jgi:ribosomal 30S subunit maturation factor RimM
VNGSAGETLVPLADEFVKTIDLPGSKMIIARPEYASAD